MATLATLTDVEAVTARSFSLEEQGYISRLIVLVSGLVVGYTGQDFSVAAGDSVTITPHDGVLRLPQHPVTAVASVTVGTTLIDPTYYTWKSNGYLRRTSPLAFAPDSQFGTFAANAWPLSGEFGWPPYPTTVVYTHGYATPPDDIALVVAEVVASRLLSGGDRAQGVVSESIDTYSVSYAAPGALGAWSPEHKTVLDRYRRSGLASVRLG